MKYQTITKTPIAPLFSDFSESSYPTIGHDRLAPVVTQYSPLATLKEASIANGNLDRYWGPFDYIRNCNDNNPPTTLFVSAVWNNLEGAEKWWNLAIGEDNVPGVPFILHMKIVEIDDSGNVVRIIKESTDLTPIPT
jgi:hypothetical protein